MRPSEPLVQFLRDAAERKGLNTASIATTLGVSRSELKHMLAGTEPMTVDLMISMAELLDLGPEDLGMLGVDTPQPETTMRSVKHAESNDHSFNPYGNHAEQILKLGFGIGCDMHIILQSDRLEDSGVPEETLEQFPDLLPIKLDAAFHHHNDPKFVPEGVTLVLSFDGLYTTTLPWSAFAQITLIPLEPEMMDDTEPPPSNGSHLRLIE